MLWTHSWHTVDKMGGKRLTYGLPWEVEKMLKDGVSIARCKKVLRECPGYEDKTPKELQLLLATAGTYFFAEMSAREMEKDYEHYRISPVHDDKTCDVCKSIATETFRFSERKVGVNFPPFHPGCRCTWTPADEYPLSYWLDKYRSEAKAKQIKRKRRRRK